MHARRAAAAAHAGDAIQSGEGSDSEGEGSDSDGGSDHGGHAMMTDVVGYLLGDN